MQFYDIRDFNWYKERPSCKHCGFTINRFAVKIGNKIYHKDCAFTKQSTNHNNPQPVKGETRQDHPRHKR